jgi:hypothetical protein
MVAIDDLRNILFEEPLPIDIIYIYRLGICTHLAPIAFRNRILSVQKDFIGRDDILKKIVQLSSANQHWFVCPFVARWMFELDIDIQLAVKSGVVVKNVK